MSPPASWRVLALGVPLVLFGGCGGGSSSEAPANGNDAGPQTPDATVTNAGPTGRGSVDWLSAIQGAAIEDIGGMAGAPDGVVAWGGLDGPARFGVGSAGEKDVSLPRGGGPWGWNAFVARWRSDGALVWAIPVAMSAKPDVRIHAAVPKDDGSVRVLASALDIENPTYQVQVGEAPLTLSGGSKRNAFTFDVDAAGAVSLLAASTVDATAFALWTPTRRFAITSTLTELGGNDAPLWSTKLTNGRGRFGVVDGAVDASGKIHLVAWWNSASSGEGVVFAPGAGIEQPEIVYGAAQALTFHLTADGVVEKVAVLPLVGDNVTGAMAPDGSLRVCGVTDAKTGASAVVRDDLGAIKWSFPLDAPGVTSASVVTNAIGDTFAFAEGDATSEAVIWKIGANGTLGWKLRCAHVMPSVGAISGDGHLFVGGAFGDDASCGDGKTFPPPLGKRGTHGDVFVARVSEKPL